MFREMRRKKQKLAEEECRAIIERANSGVMGVIGDDGYPYTVPVNPFLMGNKLYFHSAKAGHKIDAIVKAVSYTHLDVYKRQDEAAAIDCSRWLRPQYKEN